MPDPISVQFEDVTKIYRLYGSLMDQALDIFGLSWLRFWKRNNYEKFTALDGINLEIKKGERVGIMGRNGAGKTTLLKLITNNFAQTSGQITVNGTVQALMSTGLGFHPEFTGYENIRSALVYNGLPEEDTQQAFEEIIDFVELGQFLHQPVKSYSRGMLTRLQFAVSTAVQPDILIIDEVLGAGDAYFSGKSAKRVERLTKSGVTLLLVSHSTQQVLQFCTKAIWIEAGKIVMQDDALAVVKAYEEFTQRLGYELANNNPAEGNTLLDKQWVRERLVGEILHKSEDSVEVNPALVANGGISRWSGEKGLKISSVRILKSDGAPANIVNTGDSLSFEMDIIAEETNNFSCVYHFNILTEDGRIASRHCSNLDTFSLDCGEIRSIRMRYPNVLLGNGRFNISAGIYKHLDLSNLSTARLYDLISRSLQMKVVNAYRDDESIVAHPAIWQMPA